ncbi:FAD-binding oxidoreductase [Bacillus albus]|uniref:FAD-binding oxidoreductase n=1 Tax=Bacillus albus TaxID=2026189 RepID=UPI003D223F9C
MHYDENISLTGRIVSPGEAQYDSARQSFNTFFNRFPFVIVFAQNTQDVVKAVRWSLHYNVPMRVRSGGHNYEGLSVLDGGIVIDVSEINQIIIDPTSKTVTVGAGCKNLQLAEFLGKEGLAIPNGVCPKPAISGIALGGGQGVLSRPLGLLLDHVVEIEMVDANGCVLQVNDQKHPDLFWALRGGGGSFGICTSFRFRTHEIKTVGFAEVSWGHQDLKAVIQEWQKYTLPTSDKRFTPTLLLSSEKTAPLLMHGIFHGSVTDLQKLIQPLLQIGSPIKVDIKELSYLEAITLISNYQPATPFPFKSVAPFMDTLLPEEGIATIQHFINQAPSNFTVSVFFQGLGGTVSEVSEEATAYFYRKALMNMVLFSTWDKPEGAAQGIRWVEDFRHALIPFTKGVYVNTPDLLMKDWSDLYYGENFKRLTQLKAKYDPEDVFNFPQSIPPVHKK